jgi:hypothetical protein
MPEPFLPPDIDRPDFYLAAMGRSGSTMICNWLTSPPDQLVFSEPLFTEVANTRLLRIQLANFGMPVTDGEWTAEDATASARFRRMVAPRLAGKRWGVKEVLCSEHGRYIEQLVPRRVLISVRNIVDVALSFFEKHRAQGNLHRFSDEWVVDYCRREAAGLVALHRRLAGGPLPHEVVRYEDFVGSDARRRDLAGFLGWRGGGATGRHLEEFDRGFEITRHGQSVCPRSRLPGERDLDAITLDMAGQIARDCAEYQRLFDYS